MKRKYIYLLLTVLLFSCTKSYLDKLPLDSISSENYWKTATDLKLYVNQYYTSFPCYLDGASGGRGSIFWSDANSDNEIASTYDLRLSGMSTVPSSSGSWSFANIRSVNYFLANYHTVTDVWDNIRQYVGEAYFFRAYYYYSLLTLYGDVPWINRPLSTDDPEVYGARTPRNVVADSIIADLDKAISYMNPKSSVSNSRLNSDIALLFKSRVCLYEGTWEKYHASDLFGVSGSDEVKYLTLAAQVAKKLIDNEHYSIYNQSNPGIDYGFLFKQENLDNNSEIMLYKKYDLKFNLYHTSQQLIVWPLEHGITKSMVESYLCTDGLPISKSPLYAGDEGLTNVTANRDLRLSQCIWVPGDPVFINGNDTIVRYTKPYIDLSGGSRDNTGYMLKKGLDPHTNNPTNAQSVIGAIIFRYAEVLLNFVEAQAELGVISQTDIDLTINKLRDRAGVAHLNLSNIESDPNWDFPTLSPIINEVRRERRVELAYEGFRLNDLMRWNAHQLFLNKRPKGAKFVQSDFPAMIIGKDIYVDEDGYIDPYQVTLPLGYRFIPGRDYLNPISSIELTLNKNLTQNPGW